MPSNRTPTFGDNSDNFDLDDDNLVSLDPAIIQADIRVTCAKELKRYEEFRGAIERFRAATSEGITTEEMSAKAGDFVGQMRALHRDLDAERDKRKRPFDGASKTVQGFFKAMLDDLDGAMKMVNGRNRTYLIQKEAEARAKAKEEADRLQAEADKREREAMASRTEEDLHVALETSKAAEGAARKASASTSVMSQVRGDYGTVSSLRKVRKFRVVDISKVDPRYLVVDAAKVRADIKEFKEGGEQPLAGIEVYFDSEVGVR